MSDLTTLVIESLGAIAPDLDPATIEVDADLQNDLGLDSMDSLNLVVSLHEQTGVEIPERDYPKLRTVRAIAAYLGEHGAAA